MPVQRFSGLGPLDNNAYVVFDQEAQQALLVDTPIQSEGVWDFLLERELNLVYIVNTHGHFDHIFNNAYFKRQALQARLQIHKSDEPLLAALAQAGARWGIQAEPSPPPEGYLEDGQTLQVGGLSVQVLHTPGHTPGSSCLYVEGVVITGDTLFRKTVGRFDLPGGSGKQLLASIHAKLLSLPEDTIVYPGHGPSSHIGEEREHNPFLARQT